MVKVVPCIIYGLSILFSAAVDCGPLRAPLNGSLIGNLTVFPNSVQLKCDSGFILSGSTFRTCQANGSWSGLETACSGTSTEFLTYSGHCMFGNKLVVSRAINPDID